METVFELEASVFNDWLAAYSQASRTEDALASVGLFTPTARYYESPFSEPMCGWAEIYHYWLDGARAFKNKENQYEILAVCGSTGVARWRSTFTRVDNGQRLQLDCLFVVTFDELGLCSLFREWWHLQEACPENGGRA